MPQFMIAWNFSKLHRAAGPLNLWSVCQFGIVVLILPTKLTLPPHCE
ncbi:hypothetical protein CFBP7900_02200 [Xanthomonas hortorum pv. carotae]|uniref:Uncharacterized protein n=1 Tax=Xanthomonas hortorum pv. carotae TaxID=487904 RepID=A0A6V7BMM3_9XANT|nr:hypothetical protein CFBP7900_02200 [Xanthomonas hortorum pv. carotae]CAD0303530.1 hypothetical protein CFBP7900_02200 [Xanthomonas hortorum pv. carotae]